MDVMFFTGSKAHKGELANYYFNTRRVQVNWFLVQFIKKKRSSRCCDPFTYIVLLLVAASDDNAVTCGGSWSLSGIM